MQNTILSRFSRLLVAALTIVLLAPAVALAADRAALERDARNAYQHTQGPGWLTFRGFRRPGLPLT